MRRLLPALLLVALVGCTGAVDTDTDTDPGPILADPAYRFCHDPDLDDVYRDTWCDHLDTLPEDRCPALREACAQRDTDGDTDTRPPIPTGCGAPPPPGAGGSRGSRAPDAPPPPLPDDSTVFEGLFAVLRWTIAFAVAVVLVGLVVLAVRLIARWLGGRPDPVAPSPAPAPAPVEIVVPDADALPEGPSDDLLAAARRALDEQRLAEAVLLARGAALRTLGDRGWLRLHRSRTDREYVRSLRRRPDARGALEAVVRAVEDLRWGGRALSSEQARRAVEAAARLVGTAVMLLLLLIPGPARADDYAGYGDAALAEVFRRHGLDARWRLRGLDTVDETVDVLVVDGAELELSVEDGEALRAWVVDGGLLVLAGSTVGFPELGVVETAGGVPDGRLRVPAPVRAAGMPAPHPEGATGTSAFREFRGEPWVIVDGGGRPAGVLVGAVALGRGAVIGLGPRWYLTNAALIAPGNEAMLGALPWVANARGLWTPRPREDQARPVLELATIAGTSSGGQDPLGAVAHARLLPLVAQILLVLALAALWKGRAFRPLRDPPDEGRLRFAEHAQALGERYRRVGADRHAAAAFADLHLRRLGPVGLQAAAERQDYTPEEARALVARARALADDPEGPTRPGDLDTLEELWRITTSP